MIKKITPTDYPIADIITKRWSPRVFADTPITEEEAKILLEAGRWAPSSGNMQPWIVFWGIRGTEMYDRIFRCLDDYNQQWAGNSQMLWLNGFRKKMPNNDLENFHALHDLGLFMGNVLHQATYMDIAVHQMAGVLYEKALGEFNIPNDYHIATAVAFGRYGGNPEKLSGAMKAQEIEPNRKRKPQSEFAFHGNFK